MLRDVNELIKEEELSLKTQDLSSDDKQNVVFPTDDDVITLSSGELFDVIAKSDSLNNKCLFTDSPISLLKPLTSSTPIISKKTKK